MKRLGVLVAGPLIFLISLGIPLGSLSFSGHVVLGLALWMALWWMTEVVPIPATSLLPLVILPLFQVLDSREVAAPYADRNIFLFLGGFFIARAMERHGLHKRIALKITLWIRWGGDRVLILGFMLATAFLSLWISNTATTMMMLPMALAILAVRKDAQPGFDKALLLGIAYAASIGGIGTLVGTPPNIVFAGLSKELLGKEVTFARWLLVGLPVVFLFLPFTWWFLTHLRFPVSNEREPEARALLRRELEALGPMKHEEKAVLAIFVLVALLWIFRRTLHFGIFTIPGWADLLGITKYVHDSTVAIFGAMLLFALPIGRGRDTFLLDWKTAVAIPWGVVLLFGGGFALALAFKTSGLSQWFGENLRILKDVPTPVLVAAIALMVTFLTELTSNTATATLLLPVVASLATAIQVNPTLLMVPTVVSASCAFMLPVATPPNAIVFGSERLSIPDMAKTGIVLNLVGVGVVTFVTLVFGRFLF